jgi:uncharacterized protein (DUF433 family)
MSETANEPYVESYDGCYRITGTRVSLDSIVYAFLEGDSPETIVQCFPTLTLEQVYGAIAYYLARRPEIDAHLRSEEADFERRRQSARERNPELYRKLEEARRAKEPTAR